MRCEEGEPFVASHGLHFIEKLEVWNKVLETPLKASKV